MPQDARSAGAAYAWLLRRRRRDLGHAPHSRLLCIDLVMADEGYEERSDETRLRPPSRARAHHRRKALYPL